jgi:hypothetical protein
MGTINQISQDFARQIFNADYSALDDDQREFIRLHLQAWKTYRDEIIKKAVTKIDRRKIRGDQYYQVRTWYYRRIPLPVVLTAIDFCIRYSRIKKKPIFSIKYFNGRVQTEFESYDPGNVYWRESRYSDFDPKAWENEDYKRDQNYWDIWGYESWKAWKAGLISEKYFDLFCGPNSLEGLRKS